MDKGKRGKVPRRPAPHEIIGDIAGREAILLANVGCRYSLSANNDGYTTTVCNLNAAAVCMNYQQAQPLELQCRTCLLSCHSRSMTTNSCGVTAGLLSMFCRSSSLFYQHGRI